MKPKPSSKKAFQLSLTKIELNNIVSKEHPLVKLSAKINWQTLEEHFGKFYKENGRPAISTRLMISLHYLKYLNDLSDKEVLILWVENPYWQYFSGMQFFEHEFPIDSSSMTRWRKRIAQEGAEELLKNTIEMGLQFKVVKHSEIKNVNVDTTVQEKNIRFPTDSRLYHRALSKLIALAKKGGLILRQTYTRTSKRLLRQQQKFSHSRKFSQANACTRKLRTLLGRVIRDIERKSLHNQEMFCDLLTVTKKLHSQQRKDKNKIYSLHEADVSCIAKGKAHKKYEFGSKVSIVTTNKSNFILGALNFKGNPNDCKTLAPALEQVEKFGLSVETAFVDKGYRGHGIKNKTVHICSYAKKKKGQSLWNKVRRRAAIEPVIGHLKSDHSLKRNKLAGTSGDIMNLLLSCIAFNLKKILARLKSLFLFFFSLIITMLPLKDEFSTAT